MAGVFGGALSSGGAIATATADENGAPGSWNTIEIAQQVHLSRGLLEWLTLTRASACVACSREYVRFRTRARARVCCVLVRVHVCAV